MLKSKITIIVALSFALLSPTAFAAIYNAGTGGGYSSLQSPSGSYWGVAGGGGASGQYGGGTCGSPIGGYGGYDGQNGISTPVCSAGYGGGATELSVGAGGQICNQVTNQGTAGTGMVGGAPTPGQYGNGGGGGGGGGVYGGGSGGSGGDYYGGSSGGGGSSMINTRATSPQIANGGGAPGGIQGTTAENGSNGTATITATSTAGKTAAFVLNVQTQQVVLAGSMPPSLSMIPKSMNFG